MGQPVAARPKKAIFFAWMIEICAVILGLVNAYMTSLDRSELPFEKKLMVAAPFAMVAVAELSRIPLVQLFFYTRSRLIQGACLLAVFATAGLTIENFAFGIERLISLRVEDVTAARVVKDEAEENLRRKLDHHSHRIDVLASQRHEIAVQLNERDKELAQLTQDSGRIDENRKFEITQHTE